MDFLNAQLAAKWTPPHYFMYHSIGREQYVRIKELKAELHKRRSDYLLQWEDRGKNKNSSAKFWRASALREVHPCEITFEVVNKETDAEVVARYFEVLQEHFPWDHADLKEHIKARVQFLDVKLYNKIWPTEEIRRQERDEKMLLEAIAAASRRGEEMDLKTVREEEILNSNLVEVVVEEGFNKDGGFTRQTEMIQKRFGGYLPNARDLLWNTRYVFWTHFAKNLDFHLGDFPRYSEQVKKRQIARKEIPVFCSSQILVLLSLSCPNH